MNYTDEFNASNERLKKLDRESLHKELNQMSLDELQNRMNWCTHQSMEADDYLTEEELNHQIQILMDRIEDEEVKRKAKQQKTVKIKKVAILAAAIMVVVSVFSMFAIASKNKIDIKNGVIKFFHETISIRFFDKNENKHLTMIELIDDLHEHGYNNLILPYWFFSNDYVASSPEYIATELSNHLNVQLKGNDEIISLRIISNNDNNNGQKKFSDLNIATTIEKEDFYIYVFEYKDGGSQISYTNSIYSYELYGKVPLEVMINIAKTI